MMNGRGCFVSDLHMFSRRSQTHRYEQLVFDAATNCTAMILGGDIFDFCWSTRGGAEKTSKLAVGWLSRLIEQNADCQVHYVLGNHDFNAHLMERLDALSELRDNFQWHRYYLRLDDKVFLHGDVVDRSMDHREFVDQRQRWLNHAQRGSFASSMYDAAISARFHRLATMLAYPPDRVVRRLADYLDSIELGRESEVRHVYFGHTHDAIGQYCYDGLEFYNGGAPIRGVQFDVLHFEL